MEIIWLKAVVNLPAEHFDAARSFWADITGCRTATAHPDHPEHVHLLPPSGDKHLELQRVDEGAPNVHLGLLVDDVPAWTERAVKLGAALVANGDHTVLRTPGGVTFCIVPGSTEGTSAPVIDADRPHAVDQLCIDVPDQHFDADMAFWAALTGWAVNPPVFPEFRSFDQPAHLPIRLLIQRLGEDSTDSPGGHLDISASGHVESIAADHVGRGAELYEVHTHWTILRDPAGHPYCITSRAPFPASRR